MKAVERFFDPENHQNLPDKNFSREMSMVRDACLRVVSLIERVIPEEKRNVYWFQKFAEHRLLPEEGKDSFRIWMYAQDTPEKGVYLMYDTFVNVKSVIAELLRGGHISYSSFSGIGRILSREIRANRYLSPFRKGINLEFDAIENREISLLVRAVGDKAQRRLVSMVFLHLFRFLRYLAHMEPGAQRAVSLHCNYLIVLLVRHEIKVFLKYLDASEDKCEDGALGDILGSIAYQFQMEQKRVFSQEMKDFLGKTPSQQRGKLENGHGILKNLVEQVIILLAQQWKPSIQGEDIFESFMTKMEQSLKLREDISVLHRLLAIIEKKSAAKERRVLVRALQSYMQYFESFTFRLLRFEDYEEFASFFADIDALLRKAEGDFGRCLEKCSLFKIYLETTLRHISNRAELGGKSMQPGRVEAVIKQYITA